MKTMESIFGKEKDKQYMMQTLELAHKACNQGEIPIGAVVVDTNGTVIGQAFNTVEHDNCQIFHAEMMAIQQAGKYMRNWRLEGCWLYVTLEPCSMCMSLVILSRMAGVVYGAQSPVFGYHLDNTLAIELYKKNAPIIIGDVCKEQAEHLLKEFFKRTRKKDIS